MGERPTMDELRARVGSPYGDTPGTGPAGKTCGDCKHMVRARHPKCTKAKWTSGDATTIKKRMPACRLFGRYKP